MMDRTTDEREGQELKLMYNQFRDKSKDVLNNTEISYHVMFGDNLKRR